MEKQDSLSKLFVTPRSNKVGLTSVIVENLKTPPRTPTLIKLSTPLTGRGSKQYPPKTVITKNFKPPAFNDDDSSTPSPMRSTGGHYTRSLQQQQQRKKKRYSYSFDLANQFVQDSSNLTTVGVPVALRHEVFLWLSSVLGTSDSLVLVDDFYSFGFNSLEDIRKRLTNEMMIELGIDFEKREKLLPAVEALVNRRNI